MTLIKIDLETSVCRIRKAYTENRLGAQTQKGAIPKYEYPDGSTCAIGALMSKAALDRLYRLGMDDVSITSLVEAGIVSLADSTDVEVLGALAFVHDSWMDTSDPKYVCKGDSEHSIVRLAEFANVGFVADSWKIGEPYGETHFVDVLTWVEEKFNTQRA